MWTKTAVDQQEGHIVKKIGLSDFILECWGVDSKGWTFETFTDQWWEVRAVSETLGSFRRVALQPMQPEEQLGDMLDEIRQRKGEKV